MNERRQECVSERRESVCVRGERNRVGGRRECICEKMSERRVCCEWYCYDFK